MLMLVILVIVAHFFMLFILLKCELPINVNEENQYNSGLFLLKRGKFFCRKFVKMKYTVYFKKRAFKFKFEQC